MLLSQQPIKTCFSLSIFPLQIDFTFQIFGEIGNCYFISDSDGFSNIPPSVIIESIAFLIPSLIIIACYGSIWISMYRYKFIIGQIVSR